jgi:dienelactone hydrolase
MKLVPFAAIAAVLCLAGEAQAADSVVGDCRIGAYRLSDGSAVTVGPSDGGLRWRRLDGTTGLLKAGPNGALTSTLGWTGKPDGHAVSFSDCAKGEIRFDSLNGQRIAFDVQETTFTRDGVSLAGRLVLPKRDGPVPIVVLIHGSENYSGRDFYHQQWMLPAEGVGVFVYDKRGTGHSTGAFTMDFGLLADDAVAAVGEARRLAGARAKRVGFYGGSQGGWIAPLAAMRTHVDFVIVGFGLAVNALEEDQEEVALEMSLKGHSPEEIAKAQQLAFAAQTIVVSDFTRGFEEFDALRGKYKSEPWYKDLKGNLTRDFLPLTVAQMKTMAKPFDLGLAWNYDGMEVLKRLDTPELWALGVDDFEAPSAETSRRLKALMANGAPITLAMFPNAEHGIYEYVTGSDGERQNTRNAQGYYAMVVDYARDGRLHGTYGKATIATPRQ